MELASRVFALCKSKKILKVFGEGIMKGIKRDFLFLGFEVISKRAISV
jgi:hypothetical protein